MEKKRFTVLDIRVQQHDLDVDPPEGQAPVGAQVLEPPIEQDIVSHPACNHSTRGFRFSFMREFGDDTPILFDEQVGETMRFTVRIRNTDRPVPTQPMTEAAAGGASGGEL